MLQVETVGYIYMVAGGAPETNDTHAKDIADLSLAMVKKVENVKVPKGTNVEIRIGRFLKI